MGQIHGGAVIKRCGQVKRGVVCVFQVSVGPPSEVEEIFDTISYAKGSCVIRMLHDWIGTEVGVVSDGGH